MNLSYAQRPVSPESFQFNIANNCVECPQALEALFALLGINSAAQLYQALSNTPAHFEHIGVAPEHMFRATEEAKRVLKTFLATGSPHSPNNEEQNTEGTLPGGYRIQ